MTHSAAACRDGCYNEAPARSATKFWWVRMTVAFLLGTKMKFMALTMIDGGGRISGVKREAAPSNLLIHENFYSFAPSACASISHSVP